MSIDLTVWTGHRHDLLTSSSSVAVSILRATAVVQVGEETTFDALIDTGAYLSVFTQQLWTEFAGQIEWLTSGSDDHIPLWLKSAEGFTGGKIPCRIGRMRAIIYDASMLRCTSEFSIVGMMLWDDRRLPRRAVLGLYGHPLEFGFHWSGGTQPRAWIGQFVS